MTKQEILNNFITLLSTVPICNERQEYDMHDLRWIATDPSIVKGVFLFLNKAQDPSQIEEGLKIYVASLFRVGAAPTIIRNSEININKLYEVKHETSNP